MGKSTRRQMQEVSQRRSAVKTAKCSRSLAITYYIHSLKLLSVPALP